MSLEGEIKPLGRPPQSGREGDEDDDDDDSLTQVRANMKEENYDD